MIPLRLPTRGSDPNRAILYSTSRSNSELSSASLSFVKSPLKLIPKRILIHRLKDQIQQYHRRTQTSSSCPLRLNHELAAFNLPIRASQSARRWSASGSPAGGPVGDMKRAPIRSVR